MEFITGLGGLALQVYQIDQANDQRRRDAQNAHALTLSATQSRSRAMLIGGAVIVVLGLAYLKKKK